MEEYERSKRSILKKIRFRLLVLGVLIGVLAIVSITLGIVSGLRSRMMCFLPGLLDRLTAIAPPFLRHLPRLFARTT